MNIRVLAGAVSLCALIAVTWSLLDLDLSSDSPSEVTGLKPGRKSAMAGGTPTRADSAAEAESPAAGARIYRSAEEAFRKLDAVKLADLEEWLKSTGRSAESLVAAWELTRDPSLEAELAEKHASNPMVCLAMLGKEQGQIDQAWLDRLRKAAPDHPLPDCLDAAKAAKDGDLSVAKAALARALQNRGRRDSWQAERMAALREAAAAAGLDAHTAAFAPGKVMTGDTAGYVVAAGAASLLRHVRNGAIPPDEAGDAAATAISLASHLVNGAQSTILAEVTLTSVHNAALRHLPADTELGETGRTLREAAADGVYLSDFLKSSGKVAGALDYATTAEVSAFYDRWMLHGESAAHQWALERIAAAEAAPQKP